MPLVKFKEIKGGRPRGRGRGNGNGRGRGVKEDMMVIIKVIAEVEVVSEAEVGGEVMVEVITTKPKSKIREIIKPKVTEIKLKIKIKQMTVIMQSSPLAIITEDREEVHSVFIVKGVMLISTTGYINVIG